MGYEVEESAAVSRRQVDDATEALDQLVAALERNDDSELLLQQVCEHITVVVQGADIATVTVFVDGVPSTAACTHELGHALDQVQYGSAEGPCLDAARTGEIAVAGVDEARRRWPSFAEAASDAGVGSCLSAPFDIDDLHAGVVNMYGRAPASFGRGEVAWAMLYTTAAEGIVRALARYRSMRELADNLRQALISRTVIDQAKGVLMATQRVSADEAFDLLVDRSQRENVKVRDLAHEIVAGRSAPPG